MSFLKTCQTQSSWRLHVRVFILCSAWPVNRGQEVQCVSTSQHWQQKSNSTLNRQTWACIMCMTGRKKKEGFPAKWCVWIWQGACWIQRRGVLRCYCRRSWFVKHKRCDCCAGVKRMCAREGRSISSDVCLCRVQRFHPPVQMLQRLQDSSSARSVIVAIIIV